MPLCRRRPLYQIDDNTIYNGDDSANDIYAGDDVQRRDFKNNFNGIFYERKRELKTRIGKNQQQQQRRNSKRLFNIK